MSLISPGEGAHDITSYVCFGLKCFGNAGSLTGKGEGKNVVTDEAAAVW